MAEEEEELRVVCIVPKGGGECREFEVDVLSKDTGEKVKKKIERVCGIPADDLELFAKNPEEGSKNQWLKKDESLALQNVRDGATISVGVHGMKGSMPLPDGEAEGGEPTDAVAVSMASKGNTSYYFSHSKQSEVPEEHRVVSGGAPAKLRETEELLPEPKSMARRHVLGVDEVEGPSKSERPVHHYAWGDEQEFVKIYVSVEGEPEVVAAAGDGKSSQVEVKWEPRRFRMVVHGEKFDHVLDIDRIYYEVIPEECKFRVSAGKRISLSLKKKEKFTWLKLIKPE
mmetsp:Transcript_102801/g.265751  ORF Transcript_102801/g.265751 Transcript_102801/m.265751 type:complete len:285 (-) Transcript_102801:34-888(-)